MFKERYSTTAGDLIRRDLCDLAVGLAQVLAELLPAEPEAKGLLALMLFHRARQASRVNDRGDLVTLEDQDRTRWDQAQIGLARRHLAEALTGRRPGQYRIQAAIAGCHAAAPTARATDWPRIARLYRHLADRLTSCAASTGTRKPPAPTRRRRPLPSPPQRSGS